MDASLSIIIATAGRVESLRRLLESLFRVEDGDQVDCEIVVANNAADQASAQAIKELVSENAQRGRYHCWQVREPLPGKCRAQNRAIPLARGSIVALLDDDVEVTPRWLQGMLNFFASFPHEVMQGSILMRDEDRKNPQLQKALERFRTIDFIDYDFLPGTDIKTLTGGNIAVRQEVFKRVGLFDERLGPGRAGYSEDVEFAKRLLKAGMRIGYEPRVSVYNEMDPSRLTEESFRIRHERQGRSRLVQKNSSIFTIIPNLLRSIWTFGWYSLIGNERRQYRAKGRYFHYRAMLLEKTKRVTAVFR